MLNIEFKIIEAEQFHWLNCKIIQITIQESNLLFDGANISEINHIYSF